MTCLTIQLPDPAQTERLGYLLAQQVQAPAVIYLSGELGAGKTTFSRGYIQARGHSGPVKSPTYTLIEPYDLPQGPVFHLDLYRLNDPAELEFLGLQDLLDQGGVCLIEWPERAQSDLPAGDLSLRLEHTDGARRATLTAHSGRAEQWLRPVMTHFSSNSQLKD